MSILSSGMKVKPISIVNKQTRTSVLSAVKSFLRKHIFIVGFIFVLICIAPIYGIVPGHQLPGLGIWMDIWGEVSCIAKYSVTEFDNCKDVLMPLGKVSIQSMVSTWTQGLLVKFVGVEAEVASSLTAVLYIFLAYLGFYAISSKLGLSKLLAILITLLFLSSGFVRSHLGNPSLLFGFMLLPLSIYSDIKLVDLLRGDSSVRQSRRRLHRLVAFTIVFLMILLVRALIAGTEWYVTIIALTGSLVFFSVMAFHRVLYHESLSKKISALSLGAITLLSTWGLGILPFYLMIKRFSALENTRMSADFLRGQGVDMFTLIYPGNDSWLLSYLFDLKGLMPALFFGDGTNAKGNYIGLSILLLLLIGLVYMFKRRSEYRSVVMSGLFIALVVTFILSLGPSLKAHSLCEYCIQSDSSLIIYNMPAEEAVMELPTEELYSLFPLSSMRSVYRWLAYPKAVMLIFALYSFSMLMVSRRRWLMFVLLFAVVIELFPPITSEIRRKSLNYEMNQSFNKELEELDFYIDDDERVFFLSDENDYLASYIISKVSAKTYNGAGDKNLVLAREQWPEEVLRLRNYKNHSNEQNREAIIGLLDSGSVDIVIVPYFSLRWSSYWWPPSPESTLSQENDFKAYKDIPSTEIENTEYFLIIRYKKS